MKNYNRNISAAQDWGRRVSSRQNQQAETETTPAAVDPEGTQPTSGSGQSQSSETNSQKGGTDSVQSGDNFPMLMCVSVMIGSAVIIVGILFVLKRKGYKKF